MVDSLLSKVIIALIPFIAYKAHAKSNEHDQSNSIIRINYESLTHNVEVTSIRAGNHDKNGINNYYFKIGLEGLLNLSEEKKKPLEERKKVLMDLGSFLTITIPSLSNWQPDPKAKDKKNSIKISGDKLRELSAKVMTKHSVKEDDVAIQASIELWEEDRKYYFLNDDKRIAILNYFPIPYTPGDQKPKMNQDLTIQDELGTLIKIKVEYIND